MSEKHKLRNQPQTFFEELKNGGLTYKEMMDQYGLTRWGARKLGKQLQEDKSGNHEKIFYANQISDDLKNMEVPVQSEAVNYEEERRSDTSAKQTITNHANKYLKKLEKEIKRADTPALESVEPDYNRDGVTAIIHETDAHFSAHVKNRMGETIYNTDIARKATKDAFNFYTKEILEKEEETGVDEIILLLGGDLVEGENIYEGQAHKVEDKLDEQIRTAAKTYFEEIAGLKTVFEDTPMKVVCVSGNHGDLPVTSSANADDLIYSRLEDMVSISDIDGIEFQKSDRTDGLTFNYRGWKGYLCHGENRSNHIGTSSPQSDWFAMKDQFGFDAAWRGHYHTQKEESVSGAPVIMTNSRKPGDDYTDKIATFGVTGNAIYFATDDEPVSEVRKQTDVLQR